MTAADRERLKDFFGAYFHQDWAVDSETPADVVDGYLREARESPLLLARTIRAWLALNQDEQALAEML